jgi:hypothetical protein
VSINIDRILSYPWLPGRAAETAALLVGILLGSLVLLVPGQSRVALGLELLVVAGAAWTLVTLMHLQLRRYRADLPAGPHVRVALGQAASLPPVIAGVSVLAEAGGGLYWLFAGIALALAAALFNAWILLIEIVR